MCNCAKVTPIKAGSHKREKHFGYKYIFWFQVAPSTKGGSPSTHFWLASKPCFLEHSKVTGSRKSGVSAIKKPKPKAWVQVVVWRRKLRWMICIPRKIIQLLKNSHQTSRLWKDLNGEKKNTQWETHWVFGDEEFGSRCTLFEETGVSISSRRFLSCQKWYERKNADGF